MSVVLTLLMCSVVCLVLGSLCISYWRYNKQFWGRQDEYWQQYHKRLAYLASFNPRFFV